MNRQAQARRLSVGLWVVSEHWRSTPRGRVCMLRLWRVEDGGKPGRVVFEDSDLGWSIRRDIVVKRIHRYRDDFNQRRLTTDQGQKFIDSRKDDDL